MARVVVSAAVAVLSIVVVAAAATVATAIVVAVAAAHFLVADCHEVTVVSYCVISNSQKA